MAMVLTGAPGTGKTTLIHALETEGFVVYHEVAREYIKRAQQGEDLPTPWTDLPAFTARVFEARTAQFERARQTGGFLDRGVPDALAYLRHNNLEWPVEMRQWCSQNRYHSPVFLAPPWREIFERDAERLEDFEEATAIHASLVTTWREFGYEVVEVPLGTVAERVLFLKSHLPHP